MLCSVVWALIECNRWCIYLWILDFRIFIAFSSVPFPPFCLLDTSLFEFASSWWVQGSTSLHEAMMNASIKDPTSQLHINQISALTIANYFFHSTQWSNTQCASFWPYLCHQPFLIVPAIILVGLESKSLSLNVHDILCIAFISPNRFPHLISLLS